MKGIITGIAVALLATALSPMSGAYGFGTHQEPNSIFDSANYMNTGRGDFRDAD